MKRLDLANLVPGDELSGAACVAGRTERSTRGGKPYLDLTLRNATGQQQVRIWSDAMPAWAHISVGDAVQVGGVVESGWKDQPELRVNLVERLADDHPVRAEMNPISPVPLEELDRRLTAILDAIDRPKARRLVEAVLDRYADAYRTAPAAIGHHHAWLHGLLTHHVETAEACLALAGNPLTAPLIDKSLLLASALLHDLGKTACYSWSGPISISATGLGRSHITVGQELIRRVADPLLEAGEVSAADVQHLMHCVESHHGRLDWGSPTEPASAEAHLLHLADLVSARIRPLVDRAAIQPVGTDHWVRSSVWRERPFYLHRSALASEACTLADSPQTAPQAAEGQAEVDGGSSAAADDPKYGGDPATIDPPAPVRQELVSAVRAHLDRWNGISRTITRGAVEGLLTQLTNSLSDPIRLSPALCGYLVAVLEKHADRHLSGNSSETADEIRGLVMFLSDHTPDWILRQIHARKRAA